MLELPNYTYKFEVDRVVDGDTVYGWVDLGMKTKVYKDIRFMDVDTEELRSSDPERKARAYEAKDRVIELLNSGKQLYLKSERDKTGKYGRVLGWIFVEMEDGTLISVNQTLIEEGFQKLP